MDFWWRRRWRRQACRCGDNIKMNKKKRDASTDLFCSSFFVVYPILSNFKKLIFRSFVKFSIFCRIFNFCRLFNFDWIFIFCRIFNFTTVSILTNFHGSSFLTFLNFPNFWFFLSNFLPFDFSQFFLIFNFLSNFQVSIFYLIMISDIISTTQTWIIVTPIMRQYINNIRHDNHFSVRHLTLIPHKTISWTRTVSLISSKWQKKIKFTSTHT